MPPPLGAGGIICIYMLYMYSMLDKVYFYVKYLYIDSKY